MRSRWAEIDLTAVAENVITIRSWLPVNTGLIAVVKANAYGHGAVEVGRVAMREGAIGLGVATVEEARKLSSICPPSQILVMGGLFPAQAVEVAELGCAVSCQSLEMLEALEAVASSNRRIPVHLEINTGKNTLGCSSNKIAEMVSRIANSPWLQFEGIFTQFASADCDEKFTRAQFDTFIKILRTLPVLPRLRHACNSAAAYRYPEMALDAVRCGGALYGLGEAPELQPALSLHARVIQAFEVDAGETVGYLRGWRASGPTRIATIGIGYGDGVQRARSNRGRVVINGRFAPMIGIVNMDMLSVNISGFPPVYPGDVATLIGEGITVAEVAELTGTTNYEITTSIGNRVERVYK